MHLGNGNYLLMQLCQRNSIWQFTYFFPQLEMLAKALEPLHFSFDLFHVSSLLLNFKIILYDHRRAPFLLATCNWLIFLSCLHSSTETSSSVSNYFLEEEMLQNKKEDIVLGRDSHAVLHGPRSVSESAESSLQRWWTVGRLCCVTQGIWEVGKVEYMSRTKRNEADLQIKCQWTC